MKSNPRLNAKGATHIGTKFLKERFSWIWRQRTRFFGFQSIFALSAHNTMDRNNVIVCDNGTGVRESFCLHERQKKRYLRSAKAHTDTRFFDCGLLSLGV